MPPDALITLSFLRTPPCALYDCSSFDLSDFVGVQPCDESAREGLKFDDGVSCFEVLSSVISAAKVLLDHGCGFVQSSVSLVLQEGEHAGAEEDFGETELVLVSAVTFGRCQNLIEDGLSHLSNLGSPS